MCGLGTNSISTDQELTGSVEPQDPPQTYWSESTLQQVVQVILRLFKFGEVMWESQSQHWVCLLESPGEELKITDTLALASEILI